MRAPSPWGHPCRDLGFAHALQPPGAQPLSRVRPQGTASLWLPVGFGRWELWQASEVGRTGMWGSPVLPPHCSVWRGSWEPPGPRAFRPGLVWTTLPAPAARLLLSVPPFLPPHPACPPPRAQPPSWSL